MSTTSTNKCSNAILPFSLSLSLFIPFTTKFSSLCAGISYVSGLLSSSVAMATSSALTGLSPTEYIANLPANSRFVFRIPRMICFFTSTIIDIVALNKSAFILRITCYWYEMGLAQIGLQFFPRWKDIIFETDIEWWHLPHVKRTVVKIICLSHAFLHFTQRTAFKMRPITARKPFEPNTKMRFYLTQQLPVAFWLANAAHMRLP